MFFCCYSKTILSTWLTIFPNINPRLTFSKKWRIRDGFFFLHGRMGIEFARIEARVCRIEACSVKRCYRMDARLFEFLLSRSIVYANIEAVRDGNDHFGLHFFFFLYRFCPRSFRCRISFCFFETSKRPIRPDGCD